MFSEPNLVKWRRRHWVAAFVGVMAITLTPLGWIEWRQIRLLDEVSNNQVDSIMWQAYQLERELSRLEQAVHMAQINPEIVDGWSLAERYEVFLSRIDLLTKIPRRDLLEGTPGYAKAREQLTFFTTIADPLFADAGSLPKQSTSLQVIKGQIDLLTPLLADLTRESNRAVSRFVDERNAQLQQQGKLVMGLAAVQAVVMMLFMGLLIRHIRRQQRQFQRLKKLSRDLAEARDHAEAANHGKSVFLANMSHEIRTPFQGLLGMLNLLDEASLTSQQRDYLGTARDSALHLLGVLNDILDVSTMESGTLKLSLSPVHLPGILQEVDELMQVAARDKGLTLDVYSAADLPEWVTADATRLRQIMFNLINNAIKFTQEGGIIVELTRAPEGETGVVLSVRDTGVGMDEDTLNQLFTRFYQADSSLRRRIGGTGLGLEISRNLARMMGGDISVSSHVGVGSVFTVTLKLEETDAPAHEDSMHADLGQARRLNLLVAEDHPVNLKYMNILLDRMGHQATYCSNGQEALELLQTQPFDAVLLDYHMPVLDGLATTEAIRKLDGPMSGVKVILVTADVVNDTRKRALEVGVNEFTSKPLQAADLQRALAHCGLLDHHSDPESTLPFSHTSPFPLGAYEAPVRLPDQTHAAGGLIDAESYNEVLSMMPDDSLDELLKTVFEIPDGTVHVLAQAVFRDDREATGYNAHKLKGTAMLMGFRALVKTSQRIEELAKSEEPVSHELANQLLLESEMTWKATRSFQAHPVAV